MNYNDEGLGFFFELPDDWSFAPEVYNPSFPSARHFTSDRGMITVMTGEVEDSMICAASRENLFKQYLGSMGFTNVELNRDGNKLGTESNVIFAYYHQGQRKECMISAGYMGRHFLIRYEGNLTERVNNDISLLMRTFKFLEVPVTTRKVPIEQVKQMSIDNLTWVETIERKGYTGYKAVTVREQEPIKWWQFWKRWFS